MATADGERTFANSLGALETATDHVSQASGQDAFMAYVPDADGLRETDEQGAEPFAGEERNRLGILIELPDAKAVLLERHCGS